MFLNKIKLFLVISACLISFFITYNDVKSDEIKIISGIATVTDGDTLRINEKKIRLLGIDAPEKQQQCRKAWLSISFLTFNKQYDCGEISTNKLKKKINNKSIKCKWTEKDRYKRLIAECYEGKTNINAWMVQNGYAVAYRKYSTKFIGQENIARKEKLGIWAGSFEMPWEYRKNN